MWCQLSSLRLSVWVLAGLGVALATQDCVGDEQVDFGPIAKSYRTSVVPLLRDLCLKCHSSKRREGQLDLERFRNLEVVRKDARSWQKVRTMLSNGEMPPQDSRQPTRNQRKVLLDWVDAYLRAEALAGAGDPGPVVIRRLTNVEYNNTIRDLTGVDFQPARDFPEDNAAGEGFTNTGESTVMSPALLEKYLAAAQTIASQSVLLPDGFRFSAAIGRRNQTDEILDQIRALYAKHTTLLEFRDKGNVTRIQWGAVDLTGYVAALIRHRDRLRKEPRAARQIAQSERLNTTYFSQLARLVSGEEFSPLLDTIRARLRIATPDDAPAIVHEIGQWQEQLWRLESVGQMFNQGQQTHDPIQNEQEFRLAIEPQPDEPVITLHLAAGSSTPDGRVLWQEPRFERPGEEPLNLSDVQELATRLSIFNRRTVAQTTEYLRTVAEIATSTVDPLQLAKERRLDPRVLQSWADYLNVQPHAEPFAYYAPRHGRILFFVGNASQLKRGDDGFRRLLRSRGHYVTTAVPASMSAEEQFDAARVHDVVIISESIAAVDVKFEGAKSLKTIDRPIISYEPYMFDDAGWTGRTTWRDFGHTAISAAQEIGFGELSDALYLDVHGKDHPLALGLKGRVRVYRSPYTFAFGVPSDAADVVTSLDAAGRYPSTFVYEAGDALADGSAAPAARIGVFLGQAAEDNPNGNFPIGIDNLTFAGMALLNATVEFAIDEKRMFRPPLAALQDSARPGLRSVDFAVPGLLTTRRHDIDNHPFIDGWIPGEVLPGIVANSSNDTTRIPGFVLPHQVMVHPTPDQLIATGWRSPIAGLVRIEAAVVDAHPECGDGQTWDVYVQHGSRRQLLAQGEFKDRGGAVQIDPIDNVLVRQGDLVTLIIGPREHHACDSTRINLVISEQGDQLRTWNLAADVSPDILAGNPHADRYGNRLVWYFYADKVGAVQPIGPQIPAGSLITRWRAAALQGKTADANRLALEVTKLLAEGATLTSPVLQQRDFQSILKRDDLDVTAVKPSEFGLRASRFTSASTDRKTDLVMAAPDAISIRVPADLIAGTEFVVRGKLVGDSKNALQLRVHRGATANVPQGLVPDLPVLVPSGGAASLQRAFDDFRALFPRVMCCRTIVPLDAVVTLVMYHREDDHLAKLMLTSEERAELNRLWEEVRFVSQDALAIREAYPLFMEFASQVGKVPTFAPLKDGIHQRAEAFEVRLRETEPQHIHAMIEFAEAAFRRPLTPSETDELHTMYSELRRRGETHVDAFRGVLARILVSAHLLYRVERPAPGLKSSPLDAWELATRLSYFLWASPPDEPLRLAASKGTLVEDVHVIAQTQRMLQDQRVRALATEFACQWLGIRQFDTHDDKNERQYPMFSTLRGDMYEEAVRFFVDLFQRDGSILEVLNADHTFVNNQLAAFYEWEEPARGEWVRIKGTKSRGRGGVLGMAAVLAKQSGATRTSPVLRGNWIVETLLGEHLPSPPPTVPELPDTISDSGLTVRQRTEQHVRAEACAKCHVRIDPYGFALESFDAIGHQRMADINGEPVDVQATLRDGTRFEGINGLRHYLLTKRRRDFVRQFCRKLLGYALGRSIEISDEPLIEEMMDALEQNDHRFSAALRTVVKSRQFRHHRGLEATRPREE